MSRKPQPQSVAVDLSGAIKRRSWLAHWYQPGRDTPWPVFALRAGFFVLLIAGVTSAVEGQGWHGGSQEGLALVGLVDTAFAVRRKLGFPRRRRRIGLTRHARGEVLWIDTPESRVGPPEVYERIGKP